MTIHHAASVGFVLHESLDSIRRLQGLLTRVDKAVERQLAQLPEHRRTIRSIPGIGPVYTAGIVAEIGDVTRFPGDAAIAWWITSFIAGLWWPARESGGYQAEDTPMSKAGNEYLRYYLIEAANSVRLHCAEYREYYDAKHAQSSRHGHRRAAVLTARKLVRLIDHLLRAGKVYKPPTHDERRRWTKPHSARPGRHRGARRESETRRSVGAPT